MAKPKVLFLCTGNTARSQMAEAFLRRYADDQFDVYSAGLEPEEISPYARVVMEEAGVSLEGHYSKGLAQYLGREHFGYLITVCEQAEGACPVFPGMGRRLYWPFEDPVPFDGSEDEKLAKFREVRDLIERRVLEWLRDLDAEGGEG